MSWEAIVVIGLLILVVLHLYSIEAKLGRIQELIDEHLNPQEEDDDDE